MLRNSIALKSGKCTITTHVEPEIFKLLINECKKQDRTVASILRQAIKKYLEDINNKRELKA